MEDTIPSVDLSDYHSNDPERRQRFITTLGEALENVGFFALRGHTIPEALINDCYRVAEKVFALPEATKAPYEDLKTAGQRGYTRFGREHAKSSDKPDLKEFWHVGREVFDPRYTRDDRYGGNIWPTPVPEFKPVMLDFYDRLEEAAKVVLEACALYLGEAIDRFSQWIPNGDSLIRVIHYPPLGENPIPGAIRASAHEDINMITLLVESTASGLELLDREGHWRPVHVQHGSIIVDAGDSLQNITNGVFKSTTHRVVNPDDSTSARYSMPFFCHARYECDLSPLASCVQRQGGDRGYESLTVGRYLAKRLEEIGLS